MVQTMRPIPPPPNPNAPKINWGKPDRQLGRATCESIMRAMPYDPWQPNVTTHSDRAVSVCGWCVFGALALLMLALAAYGVKA